MEKYLKTKQKDGIGNEAFGRLCECMLWWKHNLISIKFRKRVRGYVYRVHTCNSQLQLRAPESLPLLLLLSFTFEFPLLGLSPLLTALCSRLTLCGSKDTCSFVLSLKWSRALWWLVKVASIRVMDSVYEVAVFTENY